MDLTLYACECVWNEAKEKGMEQFGICIVNIIHAFIYFLIIKFMQIC